MLMKFFSRARPFRDTVSPSITMQFGHFEIAKHAWHFSLHNNYSGFSGCYKLEQDLHSLKQQNGNQSLIFTFRDISIRISCLSWSLHRQSMQKYGRISGRDPSCSVHDRASKWLWNSTINILHQKISSSIDDEFSSLTIEIVFMNQVFN